MTEQDNGDRVNPADLTITPEDRERFNALKQTWENQTLLISDLYHMQNNSAFQEIISMGQIAIPLILEDLRINPSWIFMALYTITKEEDPLQSPDTKTNDLFITLDFQALKDDWLKWGEENGYIKSPEQKSDGE